MALLIGNFVLLRSPSGINEKAAYIHNGAGILVNLRAQVQTIPKTKKDTRLGVLFDLVAGGRFELPTIPLRCPKCAALAIARRISTAAEADLLAASATGGARRRHRLFARGLITLGRKTAPASHNKKLKGHQNGVPLISGTLHRQRYHNNAE